MTLLLLLWQDERIPVAHIVWTFYRFMTRADMITATRDIIKLSSNSITRGSRYLCLSVLVMAVLQSCYNMLDACVMRPPAGRPDSPLMTISGYFNQTASTVTISNTRRSCRSHEEVQVHYIGCSQDWRKMGRRREKKWFSFSHYLFVPLNNLRPRPLTAGREGRGARCSRYMTAETQNCQF